MARCRFVQPEVVRLQLVEVHRQDQRMLEEKLKETRDAKVKKAIEAELKQVRQRIANAEQDGYYVDVKKELNAGETRNVYDRMVKEHVAGQPVKYDSRQVGLANMLEYIVGWNFTDLEGKPVAFSED